MALLLFNCDSYQGSKGADTKGSRQVADGASAADRSDMERNGFYFAYRTTDEIGFSVALVYMPEEKGVQFSIMIGCLMLAVGYGGRG